jgi:undecaprenyl phosphate N,N'-diacetylbacillosamine 1-phosphate transferase
MYRSFFKRIFDFTTALILFVLLLPFFVVIAILVPLATGEQPFFFQVRPGKK